MASSCSAGNGASGASRVRMVSTTQPVLAQSWRARSSDWSRLPLAQVPPGKKMMAGAFLASAGRYRRAESGPSAPLPVG